MIIKKIRQGISYNYNTEDKTYEQTPNNWVKNPRKSVISKLDTKILSTEDDNGNNLLFKYWNFNINFIEISNKIEDKERYYKFLTILLHKNTITEKYTPNNIFDMNINDTEYVPYFSYAEIKSVLGKDFKNRINILIKDKYIELVDIKNKYYQQLYTYKPTDKLLKIKKSKKETIITKRVITSMVSYYKTIYKKLDTYKILFDKRHNHIIDISKYKYLKLKGEYYPTYVEWKLNKKLTNKKESDPLSLDSYLELGKDEYKRIQEYNKLSKLEKLIYFKKDTFGNRFYNFFTNQPTFIREYIRVDNKGDKRFLNTSIDMQNSQGRILAKIAFDKFGKNVFTDDVNNNDIYLALMDKNNYGSRDISKEVFFKFIFGAIWYTNKAGKTYMNKNHKQFEVLYPQLARFIQELKQTPNELEKNHSILAQMLQKMESSAWSEIWYRLIEEGIEHESIHDEVIVNENDKDRAEEIINEIMIKHLEGVKVVLKNK